MYPKIISQKQPQLNKLLTQDRGFYEVSVVSKVFFSQQLHCPCEALALTNG